MADIIKCPNCAEEILAEAVVCRFCRTEFEIHIRGYCSKCHALVDCDEKGKCSRCGSEVIDRRIERQVKQTTELAQSQAGPPKPGATPGLAKTEPAPNEIEIFERKGEGVGTRLSASFLDLFVVYLIYGLALFILAAITGVLTNQRLIEELPDIYIILALLTFPVIWVFYFTFQEGIFSTTLGKIIGVWPLQLKVIRKDGRNCGFGRAFVRALIGFFETNIIGAIVIGATESNQRLGDLAAGTLVIDKTKFKRVEFLPTSVIFEFLDGRREELVQVTKGVITKWLGVPQWMNITGINRLGRSIKLRAKIIRGVTVFFNEPMMDQLRGRLEGIFNFRFKEVLEWWRIVVIAILLVGLAACFLIVFASSSLPYSFR